MTEVGQIHVGDMINVFRHGSLVMENLGDSSTQHSGSILYGTVQGAIGMKYSLKNSVKLNYIYFIFAFSLYFQVWSHLYRQISSHFYLISNEIFVESSNLLDGLIMISGGVS